MSAFEAQPCVGLFGTCGPTTFRNDLFIPEYERLGIPYFNPQVEVEGWRPELAEIEADHLTYDVVQCWPILGSTYGTGSLAEQGFSIANSLRSSSPLPKFVIAMVEMDLDDSLTDLVARKESLRARQIAAINLAKGNYPNFFEAKSLEEMLEKSIVLFGVAKQLVDLTLSSNPAYRHYVESRQKHALVAAMQNGRFGSDAQKLVSNYI